MRVRPATAFLARRVDVDVVAGGERVELRYRVDERPPAAIRVRYPDGVALVPSALELIAAAAAAYLGSLCLAREVRVAAPLRPALLAELEPLVRMLYDVRRWKDRLPPGGMPALRTSGRSAARPDERPLDRRAAVALWSGGKDSTLALLTLRANGYRTHPLHVTANAGVQRAERQAVRLLAAALEEPHDVVELAHDEFVALTNAYALEWDDFPLANRVPFGRDLLLSALAVPYALARGASRVSLGHDRDCRRAEVAYEGRRFPRNDLESIEGAVALEAAMRRHVHPGLRLLPPLADLSELRILHDMLRHHPQLMATAAFCFWGESCGRCAKCLRYALADRVYGDETLTFAVNPLSAGACPELQEHLSPQPRSTLFQTEVLVLLGRLAQRGEARHEDHELERFRATRLAAVEPHLDAWERELLAAGEDPQLPAGFRPLHPDPLPSVAAAA